MKQKLGLDFDGVIQDSRLLKSNYLRTQYKVNVDIDLCKRSQLVGGGYITSEQYSKMVDELYETELGLDADEVNGSVESIKRLVEVFDIVVVTSRSSKGVDMAKKWLKNHMLDSIEVVGTNNRSKDTLLEKFDHYLDDDLEKLIPLRTVVKNNYLLSWKYNQGEQCPSWVKRIESWNEFETLLMI